MSEVENCLGGTKMLEGMEKQEALDLLNTCLDHLAKGDGPSYKVIKVISVTGQLVAGDLYSFKLELDNGTDIKPCSVKIWYRCWLKENGINIKIKFAGEDGELDRTW
ncbi:cystatin-like protein isoform X2 [Drosophila serrata]|uniref:cystatin-like protein isoform X2 n=1 Tax=Drosophila serrata TaxID=7274 RepID=UPI000A1D1A2E|nr:cystatin-like protein isoform X2 [Drosophila serrata]KAH8361074.1 hypothetical protein KR200_001314 [Drosophila serrata]